MIKRLKDMDLPDDIKDMDEEELELTAFELRDFLISQISRTGGHLASNLGVVELTLALQKAFDTSYDRIIWDVGHQSYIHKILTGRRDSFSNIRQLDGISGFPKRNESCHDAFDTGHSSNSLSVAYGMAVARDRKGENRHILAVIGDGSLTGGEAYEGLNNLGDSGTKVIVILNDNGMSISPNTGGISKHLSKLRVSKGYYNFKGGIKKAVEKIPGIGDGIYSGASKMRDIVKYALVEGVFFEELGFTYFGPVDGHDIGALFENLESAKNAEGPCIVHVITKKGKGYRNAENNPDIFHGTGPFHPETGIPESKGSTCTFSEIFGNKMIELAEKDERICAVSAAMINGTGLNAFARRFPGRTYDAGIAEQHAVSFAAGLAVSGMKPVVALYSSFLQRAYDQIIIDTALNKLPVVFAIDRAGVTGQDGETHNGIFDLSFMTHIPEMTVLAPSDGKELADALEYAVKLDSPAAVRYPKGDSASYEIGSTQKRVPFDDGALLVREGTDTCIWACGSMVKNAVEAADLLQQSNISCAVYNARIVKPIDDKKIMESANRFPILFTAEDNIQTGGFGSLIADFIAEKRSDTKVIRFGWPEKFVEQGTISQLMHRYRLDGEGLAERISEIIEREA